MESIKRAAMRVILPDGIIFGGVLVALLVFQVPGGFEPYSDVFGIAVALVGLGIALRFKRQRFLFGLLVLGLADLALNHATGAAAFPLAAAASLLLPLNLAFLAIIQSRGGRQAAVLAGVVAIQVMAVAATASPVAGSPSPWTGRSLPLSLPIPALVVVVTGAAFAVAIGLAIRWEPKRRSFFWAILATPLAVNAAARGDDATSTTILVTAGVLLVIAALEDIHALAYSDPLTGLPGRRALRETMERLGRRYTLAMVDVDHFKAFNDRWGHETGDQTLRMVSQRLRGVGGGGRAFRYGGEEFVVVFPGLGLGEALPHLDAARRAVAARPFTVRRDSRALLRTDHPAPQETVTVSIGAAAGDGSLVSPAEILKRADQALYHAKEQGRNRVVPEPPAQLRAGPATPRSWRVVG